MESNIREGLYSILAGSIASILAISISGGLDYIFPYQLANILGLLTAMFINFLMQKKIFLGNIENNKSAYLLKYLFTDILILGSNQLIFHYVIKNKKYFVKYINKNYYNLIWRMIIGSVIWVCFSFPLRKYWVFKNQEELKNKKK
jgi:putative flippase GtrA